MVKNIKKINIHTYISRVNNLTNQLDELGKKVDQTFKKYYILNGLLKSEEWKIGVTMIRTMDNDDSWSIEKLETHCFLLIFFNSSID